MLTPADDMETLEKFYTRVRPGGWWGPVAQKHPNVKSDTTGGQRWMGWFLGTLFLYAGLLGIGHIVIGNTVPGVLLLVLAVSCSLGNAEACAQTAKSRNAGGIMTFETRYGSPGYPAAGRKMQGNALKSCSGGSRQPGVWAGVYQRRAC